MNELCETIAGIILIIFFVFIITIFIKDNHVIGKSLIAIEVSLDRYIDNHQENKNNE